MYVTLDVSGGRPDRAASELVGVILLFGMVIAGAGLIFWVGMDATDSVQSANEMDTAETSLVEVGSKLSTLSFRGEGAVTSFDMSGKNPGDVRVVNDGKILFRLNGESACTAEKTLGSIIYHHDSGATVAYQAGGVFKQTDGGTAIVQSPSLEYRTEIMDGEKMRTIRFPVVNVSGEVDTSGKVSARAKQSQNNAMRESLCLEGPNEDKIDYIRSINITVINSTYADGWERYFVDEFGAANVSVHNGNVTAVVPLGTGVSADQFPINNDHIFGGIYIGDSAGELNIQTPNVEVNSYDSSEYGTWGGGGPIYNNSGDIYTRGDVTVHAQSHINGSVFAEGTVDLDTSSCAVMGGGGGGGNQDRCVTQNVFFNNSTGGGLLPTDNADRETVVGGDWYNGTIVPELEPMDPTIDHTLDTVKDHNHNEDADDIDSNAVQYDSGSATIKSGVYYLDDLTVPSGNTLTIDTSTGDVVLAIEDSFTVESGATVKVVGGSQVRAFVGGTSGDQLAIAPGATSPGDKATVEVHDGGDRSYRSEGLFVVCKAGCDATFGDYSEFTGVLYGPGTAASTGTVELKEDSEVWGALVGGTVDFSKKAMFHFDTDLENAGIDSDGDGIPDDEDDNPNTADTDDDGVPDEYDDCDGSAGDGANGCLPVTKSNDGTALVFNQSKARVTVVGSMVADNKTVTRQVSERLPLDVQFAIDDSGSMLYGADIGGWYYTSSYPNEVYDGEAWYLYDTATDSYKWVIEDETYDGSKWDYVYRFNIGNDPYDFRVDATQSFIGSLNDSLDEVGVYLFDGDVSQVHDIRSKGDKFDEANQSVELVDSSGSTNIAETITDATDRFEQHSDDEKVIVLLTDGKHTADDCEDDGNCEQEVRNAADYAHDNNVTIYTVALGDGADEDLLTDISETNDPHTNGSMYKADDYTELKDVFDQIAGETINNEVNLIEYKDTTVQVNVDGASVVLSGNANDPTDSTRPSKVIDIADMKGADDDEVEQYVGTLLSAQATTEKCDDHESFDTETHNGEEYKHVTCTSTGGVFDDVANGSTSDHRIYVDGESLPSSSDFDGGWFKDQSLRDVLDEYEADTGKTLVDDAAGEFDLGENDAIIIVRTNSSDSDTDYVVLHFEALDTDVDYNVSDSDTDDGTDVITDDSDSETTDENDYVVDIGGGEIEIGNDSNAIRPVTPLAATHSPTDALHHVEHSTDGFEAVTATTPRARAVGR